MLDWLVGLLLALAPPPDFSGPVVAVHDGDTLTVLHQQRRVRVRLHGIDCPELDQAVGSDAHRATARLVLGKAVKVHPHELDRHGRTVADVMLPNGRSLNHELVRRGWAWHYRRYAPHDAVLARLEAAARAAPHGLWRQPNPIPPWVWRARLIPSVVP